VITSFTDPGVRDTHIAFVNWGDGRGSRATIKELGGSGNLLASHVYTDAGSYTASGDRHGQWWGQRDREL